MVENKLTPTQFTVIDGEKVLPVFVDPFGQFVALDADAESHVARDTWTQLKAYFDNRNDRRRRAEAAKLKAHRQPVGATYVTRMEEGGGGFGSSNAASAKAIDFEIVGLTVNDDIQTKGLAKGTKLHGHMYEPVYVQFTPEQHEDFTALAQRQYDATQALRKFLHKATKLDTKKAARTAEGLAE